MAIVLYDRVRDLGFAAVLPLFGGEESHCGYVLGEEIEEECGCDLMMDERLERKRKVPDFRTRYYRMILLMRELFDGQPRRGLESLKGIFVNAFFFVLDRWTRQPNFFVLFWRSLCLSESHCGRATFLCCFLPLQP